MNKRQRKKHLKNKLERFRSTYEIVLCGGNRVGRTFLESRLRLAPHFFIQSHRAALAATAMNLFSDTIHAFNRKEDVNFERMRRRFVEGNWDE